MKKITVGICLLSSVCCLSSVSAMQLGRSRLMEDRKAKLSDLEYLETERTDEASAKVLDGQIEEILTCLKELDDLAKEDYQDNEMIESERDKLGGKNLMEIKFKKDSERNDEERTKLTKWENLMYSKSERDDERKRKRLATHTKILETADSIQPKDEFLESILDRIRFDELQTTIGRDAVEIIDTEGQNIDRNTIVPRSTATLTPQKRDLYRKFTNTEPEDDVWALVRRYRCLPIRYLWESELKNWIEQYQTTSATQ